MLELKVRDVIRIKRAFDFDATGTDLNVKIKVGVGQTFTVTNVVGDNVVVNLRVTGQFDAVITTTWHIAHIDEDAIEVLRPVEEDLDPEDDEPSEKDDKPTGEKEMATQRFSKANIRATTKRPEVFLYQEALKTVGHYEGAIDGWYGKGSAEAVKKFQAENDLGDDGIIGRGTATELIKQAIAAGFEPDLLLRVMSVITFYEVSNRRDAFGMAENDIGDSAGANYGFMQANSYGSVVSILKSAGRGDLVPVYNNANKALVNPTIKDWFGSSEGIAAQVKYFRNRIVKIAMKELHEFGCFDDWENDASLKKYWERAVLLFCDSVIQNGTMWSGSRKPFWKAIEKWEESDPKDREWPELYYGTWWDEMLGEHIKYVDMKEVWWKYYEKNGVKDRDSLDKKATKAANISAAQELATQNCASSPEAQLVVVAQFRARSSWDKYWFQAVATRRITDATGSSSKHPEGVVNGADIELPEDYHL